MTKFTRAVLCIILGIAVLFSITDGFRSLHGDSRLTMNGERSLNLAANFLPNPAVMEFPHETGKESPFEENNHPQSMQTWGNWWEISQNWSSIASGHGTPEDPFVIENYVFASNMTQQNISTVIAISNSRDAFIIRNCSFLGQFGIINAITLQNSTLGRIENCYFQNLSTAIFFTNCSQMIISACNFSFSFRTIEILECSTIRIHTSEISFSNGIDIQNCEKCEVDSCLFLNTTYRAIFAYYNNVTTIQNNQILFGRERGIILGGELNSSCINNTVAYLWGGWTDSAIIENRGRNIRIEKNTCEYNKKAGIDLGVNTRDEDLLSRNLTIVNNRCSFNLIGFRFAGLIDSRFEGNLAWNNTYDGFNGYYADYEYNWINLGKGRANIFCENNSSRNGRNGMYLKECFQNIISNNIFENNLGNGLELDNCENNRIQNNLFRANRAGVTFSQFSKYNWMSGNTFSNTGTWINGFWINIGISDWGIFALPGIFYLFLACFAYFDKRFKHQEALKKVHETRSFLTYHQLQQAWGVENDLQAEKIGILNQHAYQIWPLGPHPLILYTPSLGTQIQHILIQIGQMSQPVVELNIKIHDIIPPKSIANQMKNFDPNSPVRPGKWTTLPKFTLNRLAKTTMPTALTEESAYHLQKLPLEQQRDALIPDLRSKLLQITDDPEITATLSFKDFIDVLIQEFMKGAILVFPIGSILSNNAIIE